MSGETGREVNLPDYEVGQYLPNEHAFGDEERRQIREEYGFIRAYFKMRPQRHRRLQRWLNQSRNGQTYDQYLEQSVYYSLGAGLVAVLVAGVISMLAGSLGLFSLIESPVRISASQGVVQVYETNRLLFVAAQFALAIGAGTTIAVWFARYYYPLTVVDARRRSIAFMLPNAIVMMYALSHGGMSLPEVIERVADAEDAYGEVANEFDMIARDMNLFGNDPYTAIRNARNLTPSDPFEQFLDDMVNLIESGGDVTDFFQEQSKTYLRRAQEEQEDFLETLAVMSEVFIVAFVAAPLFLVVTLLVISVLGGNQLVQLFVIVYAVIPLSMGGFLVLLSTLSEPYVYPETHLEIEDEPTGIFDGATALFDEQFEQYRRHQRRRQIKAFLTDPLRVIHDEPLYSLAVTGPLALALVALLISLGEVPLSYDALVASPVQGTTRLFVFPFLVMAVPLSFFHELKRGHDDEVAKRFPDTLNILASANNMGVPLADALEIVARWSGGRFAKDLRLLRNDVKWSSDLRRSLLRFANRLRVPQVSQTIKLIAEGVGSTRDLSRVLNVAAEDTRNRHRLLENRRRALSSYVAVVIIGFLVYLVVIVLLDTSYLTPIAELGQGPVPTDPESSGGFTTFQGIPVKTYRMLFYHSVIIQAIGSGLLTGELSDNNALSGLKYSIFLVLLGMLAFQFV